MLPDQCFIVHNNDGRHHHRDAHGKCKRRNQHLSSFQLQPCPSNAFSCLLVSHLFHRCVLWRKQAREVQVSANVAPMESGGFAACRIRTPHSKMFLALSFRSSCLYYEQLIVALIMTPISRVMPLRIVTAFPMIAFSRAKLSDDFSLSCSRRSWRRAWSGHFNAARPRSRPVVGKKRWLPQSYRPALSGRMCPHPASARSAWRAA